MPIYEYECKSCGKTFEKMVRISDTEQSQACPTCKNEKTSKKLSLFASRGEAKTSGPTAAANCSTTGGFR